MVTNITIPPAALEAGAKALCAKAGYAWTVTPDVHAHWREQARSAFLAMLKAWPNAFEYRSAHANYGQCLSLPLTEASDDQ